MRLKITNTDAAPLALELSGLRVTTDEAGALHRDEELNDLIIFPMQTSIPPGRTQVVQVRYVGDQEIDNGRVYAVRISQLPVNVNSSGGEVNSQVKIGLSFLSHLLVQNSDEDAKIVVSDISKLDNGELAFGVENIGTSTVLLKPLVWKITDENGVSKEVGPGMVDNGPLGALIPATPKRTLVIASKALDGLGTITTISTDLSVEKTQAN